MKKEMQMNKGYNRLSTSCYHYDFASQGLTSHRHEGLKACIMRGMETCLEVIAFPCSPPPSSIRSIPFSSSLSLSYLLFVFSNKVLLSVLFLFLSLLFVISFSLPFPTTSLCARVHHEGIMNMCQIDVHYITLCQ